MAIPPPGYDFTSDLRTAGFLPGSITNKPHELHSPQQINAFIKAVLNDISRPAGIPVFVHNVVVGFLNAPNINLNACRGDVVRLVEMDEISAPTWPSSSPNWSMMPMSVPAMRETRYTLDETVAYIEIPDHQIGDVRIVAQKLADAIKQFCIGHTAHFQMDRMMSTMSVRFSFRSLALRVSVAESEKLFDRADFAPVDHKPVLP